MADAEQVVYSNFAASGGRTVRVGGRLKNRASPRLPPPATACLCTPSHPRGILLPAPHAAARTHTLPAPHPPAACAAPHLYLYSAHQRRRGGMAGRRHLSAPVTWRGGNGQGASLRAFRNGRRRISASLCASHSSPRAAPQALPRVARIALASPRRAASYHADYGASAQ